MVKQTNKQQIFRPVCLFVHNLKIYSTGYYLRLRINTVTIVHIPGNGNVSMEQSYIETSVYSTKGIDNCDKPYYTYMFCL